MSVPLTSPSRAASHKQDASFFASCRPHPSSTGAVSSRTNTHPPTSVQTAVRAGWPDAMDFVTVLLRSNPPRPCVCARPPFGRRPASQSSRRQKDTHARCGASDLCLTRPPSIAQSLPCLPDRRNIDKELLVHRFHCLVGCILGLAPTLFFSPLLRVTRIRSSNQTSRYPFQRRE